MSTSLDEKLALPVKTSGNRARATLKQLEARRGFRVAVAEVEAMGIIERWERIGPKEFEKVGP